MNNHISVLLGVLDNNDASAIVRCGNTEVACGIHGPVEARAFKDNHNGIVVDATTRSNVALPTHSHKHIDLIVADVVTRCIDARTFPNTQLNIFIEVLSDDGGLLSVVGNAVYFALLDSGLPMKHRFVSFFFSFVDGKVVMDPSRYERERAIGSATVFANAESMEPIYITQEDCEAPPELYQILSTGLRYFTELKCNQLNAAIKSPEPLLRFSR